MPPLMKLWVDEVLAFGWAYGPGGTALKRKGPVARRLDRRPGGRRTIPDSYNRYVFDAFLPPYEQTAALMRNALRCRRSCCTAHTASATTSWRHTPGCYASRLLSHGRTGRSWPSTETAPACEVPADRGARRPRQEGPTAPPMDHAPPG